MQPGRLVWKLLLPGAAQTVALKRNFNDFVDYTGSVSAVNLALPYPVLSLALRENLFRRNRRSPGLELGEYSRV